MEPPKINVAIIGTGNIGSDLLVKIMRSPYLSCTLFTGRNLDSRGMKIARDLGINVSDKSIDAIISKPDLCDIVFDATSVTGHRYNAPILEKLNKFTLDLTPACVGKMCIPVINMSECLNECNVNMITCGGQAAIPIAYAISQVHPEAHYCELVASISSKSAGMGTRNNIDEFTQTTRNALKYFTKIPKTKAIIILNPAEPPIIMRNTVYMLIDNPDMQKIKASVYSIVDRIRKYVPGYKLIVEPVFENGRVTTTVEVRGRGDFLPEYSGNLDIITSAAVCIAEEYAQHKGRKNE